jgi:hypothetical protein
MSPQPLAQIRRFTLSGEIDHGGEPLELTTRHGVEQPTQVGFPPLDDDVARFINIQGGNAAARRHLHTCSHGGESLHFQRRQPSHYIRGKQAGVGTDGIHVQEGNV